MANDTPTYRLLKLLSEKVGSLGVVVHLMNRPKTVAETVKSFVVVSLPTRWHNTVHGDDGFRDELEGLLHIFYKCKSDGTPNIDGQTALVRNAVKLFPIKGDGAECVRPRQLVNGYDGYGYQVTSVMFDIRLNKN
jgi:hypothetical protein